MNEVMVNEIKRLFPEENVSSLRPLQESIQDNFVLVHANGRLLKAVINEDGQTKGWLNVAPLNKRITSRCR